MSTQPSIAPAQVSTLACDAGSGPRPFSLAVYSAARDRPGAPTLLLAHGAGGTRESPFMLAMAGHLTAHGFPVVLFNFPYAETGRKPPDRQPLLHAAFNAAADAVRRLYPAPRPLIFGGKSMGGRVAAVAAANRDDVAALLYLGFPLHPPGRPERLRLEPLECPALPQLFCQGERDAFGTPEALRTHLAPLRRATILPIPNADHSFGRPKRDRVALAATLADVAAAVERWAVQELARDT